MNEVKNLQAKVDEIKEEVDENVLVFSLGTGGAPRVVSDNVECIFGGSESRYPVGSGWAKRGAVCIIGEETDKVDNEGNQIYVSNGTEFVYKYKSGSPENFDSGKIVEVKKEKDTFIDKMRKNNI